MLLWFEMLLLTVVVKVTRQRVPPLTHEKGPAVGLEALVSYELRRSVPSLGACLGGGAAPLESPSSPLLSRQITSPLATVAKGAMSTETGRETDSKQACMCSCTRSIPEYASMVRDRRHGDSFFWRFNKLEPVN